MFFCILYFTCDRSFTLNWSCASLSEWVEHHGVQHAVTTSDQLLMPRVTAVRCAQPTARSRSAHVFVWIMRRTTFWVRPIRPGAWGVTASGGNLNSYWIVLESLNWEKWDTFPDNNSQSKISSCWISYQLFHFLRFFVNTKKPTPASRCNADVAC